MLESTSAPSLYSFVSYRRESFGGFLFNPYLQVELPLDNFELAVVELCDGRHAVAIMPVELARTFRTDRATAERRLLRSLERLNGYCALNWKGISPHTFPSIHQTDIECSRECPAPSPEAKGCLSAPLSILWEVTHACNLNCLHCLSSSGKPAPGELSTAEAKALIEELARLRVFSVTVGGGEPLLRRDLFELLEIITQKNLAARLSTNGYGVTDDTLHRLADLNVFSVQVSIDGLQETHDRFRGRPGAFDRAVRALRLFREAGYHTFLTATATALNVEEIPALLDLALDLGVSTFKLGPYVPMGRATQNESLLSLSPQQLQELALSMHQRKQETAGKIDLQVDGLFPWLFEPAPASSECPEVGPGCSAGTSSVTVSYDGNVYPCVYMRDMSAGNVRHELLGDIWRNEGVFGPLRTFDRKRIKGECRTCAYRATLCRGGCRGAALAATGDLYGRDPNCWLSARTSGDAP
jgi:radical SAM protein with 4Fe4S-binding SPASM domain